MQAAPPIFVINLARSVHRFAECQKQLQSHAIRRIEAVDGELLSESELQKHYDSEANAGRFYRDLSRGEVGCYLSHRKAWQTIVDEQLPYAVILEDDIELQGNIEQVGNVIGQLDVAWDYIKLAEYPEKRRAIWHWPPSEKRVLIYNKVPARTCAQAVSLAGARKLLDNSERFFRPIDLDLQYWWEKDIEVFGLKPYPFRPSASVRSDIDATQNRRSQPTRRWQKVWQQCVFLAQNRRHNARRLRALVR
ncbi:glycosyltransferase family 25 protein [Aestuariibacter salexigens]|uniref:glycosyltransferase family 25 protein n=1 Tax=Aestuariibacter salexigens TaxID=226010 RepID=UPI00042A318F|nr:glycosyltransferase family 25 protein [Aestuariibacter salexigens]